MKRILVLTAALTVATVAPRAQTSTGEIGTINFPTSAKPAAQAPFLVGTKALYNFEFDIAADAFQQSQKADPGFALAYWGEAMSFNHPLWAQQDRADGRGPGRESAGRQGARSGRIIGGAVRRRRQAGARHRLCRRHGQPPRQVSGGRRNRVLVCAGASRHRAPR